MAIKRRAVSRTRRVTPNLIDITSPMPSMFQLGWVMGMEDSYEHVGAMGKSSPVKAWEAYKLAQLKNRGVTRGS